ncbi:DUF4129 domain-containing protein, partial [Candidatus Bipolaricaulota bacterium]|nr:DUF4129 domain-containing protein [Candidatus Bipolaricaulota bacterium]
MRHKPAALTITAVMVLAIAAVLLLSMSIDSLALRPGIGRPEAESEMGSASQSTSTNTHQLVRVLRAVWAVLAVVIVLCLLFWPTFRRLILKYMLAQLTYFAILFLLAALIFATIRTDEQQENGPMSSTDGPRTTSVVQDGSATAVPPDGFETGRSPAASEIPLWQIGFIASAIVLALIALAIGGLYVGRRMCSTINAPPADLTALQGMAQEADKAFNRLQAGEDPGTVILECYRRMIAIVTRHSGVESRAALTPREFAHLLSEQQLGTEHVIRLTAIFEKVRYGARRAAPYMEEALA